MPRRKKEPEVTGSASSEKQYKALPRKLLIVKRAFPKSEGYDVMIEIAERTHTYQVTTEVGEEMTEKCIAVVVEIAMRGMPIPPMKGGQGSVESQ